jgi:hypothetical protein
MKTTAKPIDVSAFEPVWVGAEREAIARDLLAFIRKYPNCWIEHGKLVIRPSADAPKRGKAQERP